MNSILIVGVLGLAGVLALERYSPMEIMTEMGVIDEPSAPEMPKPASPPRTTIQAVMIPDVRLPESLGAYRAIVNRPLFRESRRPPVPKPRLLPQQVAAPAPIKRVIKTGQFRLVGVMIEDGGQVALLRDVKSRELSRVKEGDTVMGWIVKEIEPRSVSLRQDDVTDTVLLRDNVLTDAEKQAIERNAGPVPGANNNPAAGSPPARNAGRLPGRIGQAAKPIPSAPALGPASRVPSKRLKSQVP